MARSNYQIKLIFWQKFHQKWTFRLEKLSICTVSFCTEHFSSPRWLENVGVIFSTSSLVLSILYTLHWALCHTSIYILNTCIILSIQNICIHVAGPAVLGSNLEVDETTTDVSWEPGSAHTCRVKSLQYIGLDLQIKIRTPSAMFVIKSSLQRSPNNDCTPSAVFCHEECLQSTP